jgi:hypothetical protein
MPIGAENRNGRGEKKGKPTNIPIVIPSMAIKERYILKVKLPF